MGRTDLHEQLLRDPRVVAFLATIRRSEGANYNTIVGGGTFSDYSRHPNKAIALNIKGKRVVSTAAGGYQFIIKTWNGVKAVLGLPDFSPHSQDLGAIELLKQRSALTPLLNNDFAGAVYAARKEWASFPGAGYNQNEQSLNFLQSVYNAALAKAGAPVALVSQSAPVSIVTVTADDPAPEPSNAGNVVAVIILAVIIGKILG